MSRLAGPLPEWPAAAQRLETEGQPVPKSAHFLEEHEPVSSSARPGAHEGGARGPWDPRPLRGGSRYNAGKVLAPGPRPAPATSAHSSLRRDGLGVFDASCPERKR